MGDNNKKPMTIDDLALVVQAGFKSAKEDNESLAVMVAKGFEDVVGQIGGVKKDVAELKQEVSEVKHEVSAVKSNVNNYLELSEKRYVELKQRDMLLAKWIKLVAEKTGVPVDLSLLEKI